VAKFYGVRDLGVGIVKFFNAKRIPLIGVICCHLLYTILIGGLLSS